MKIVIAPRARRDLTYQLDYLIDQGATKAARRLDQRLVSFVERMLAAYPKTGVYLAERDLWETWVPGTRLIVWYRFSGAVLEIVRIWHTAQDRGRPS